MFSHGEDLIISKEHILSLLDLDIFLFTCELIVQVVLDDVGEAEANVDEDRMGRESRPGNNYRGKGGSSHAGSKRKFGQASWAPRGGRSTSPAVTRGGIANKRRRGGQ